MAKAIREFYATLPEGGDAPVTPDRVKEERERKMEIAKSFRRVGVTIETLVHEFTHHLRHVDETRGGLTRTPPRLNSGGERISSLAYDRKEYNSAVNLEEAATVAESLVRIQEPSKGANGYYTATKAYGDTPMERYTHDRATLVTDKPMRGRKAEKKVTEKFGEYLGRISEMFA